LLHDVLLNSLLFLRHLRRNRVLLLRWRLLTLLRRRMLRRLLKLLKLLSSSVVRLLPWLQQLLAAVAAFPEMAAHCLRWSCCLRWLLWLRSWLRH
jgi:hypothetical protein